MSDLRSVLCCLALCAILVMSGCGGGGSSSPAPTPAPVITQQPQSLTVNAGQPAAFTVAATGASTYQWLRNGQAIPGATSATYTLNPATSQNNGDTYQVAVGNAGGTSNSSTASLRVTGVAVIAGQPGGMGYEDGPPGQARFWGPIALAFDPSGKLFVADYNAIRMIDTQGNVSTVVGSPRICGGTPGTGAAAVLCYPYSLATDALGKVYAGDNLGTLWQITGNSASIVSQAFTCPFGLAVLGTALYVADNCQGTLTGGGHPPLNIGYTPMGLSASVLPNTLYVANDAVIQSVTVPPPVGNVAVVSVLAGMPGMPGSATGIGSAARFGCAQYADLLGAGINTLFNGAFGIATNASGLSYVSDYCNGTIRSVDGLGNVSALAGSPAVVGYADGHGSAASFWAPAGLALDGSGNVYVADFGNALIRKVTSAGAVSTFAGTAGVSGAQDGQGLAAQFRSPDAIAIDNAGKLYVADAQFIRLITPAAQVSTILQTVTLPQKIGGIAVDPAGATVYLTTYNLAGTAGVYSLTLARGTQTLIAGGGAPGFADGTGAAASFNAPQGLVLARDGNLYVADQRNSAIRKVTVASVAATPLVPIGMVTTPIGTSALPMGIVPGGLPGRIGSPRGLALLPAPSASSVSLAITDEWESVILRADLP